MFSPNQKVVCIRTRLWLYEGEPTTEVCPVKDGVYVIEAVFPMCGTTGLRLVGFNGWWDADEFRPLLPAEVVEEEVVAAE